MRGRRRRPRRQRIEGFAVSRLFCAFHAIYLTRRFKFPGIEAVFALVRGGNLFVDSAVALTSDIFNLWRKLRFWPARKPPLNDDGKEFGAQRQF